MANPTDPKTLRETNELLGQQSALWSQIATSTRTMAEALGKLNGGLQSTTEQAQQVNRSLAAMSEAAAQGVRDVGQASAEAAAAPGNAARSSAASLQSMTQDLEDQGTALERFARDLERDKALFGDLFSLDIDDQLGMWSDASKKFGENFSGSIASANAGVMSLLSGVGALTSGLFNVAKAAIAIPFQLFGMLAEEGNALLDRKSSGGGGGGGAADNSFSLALEDVREKLGNIAEGEGARVVAMYEKINKSQSNIAGTGLTMAGVFGKSAEALKAMSEMYEGMGPLVYIFGQELEGQADKLAIYQKGLGLSAEEMQAFGSKAAASGKPLTSVLEDASRMAISLGKKFGISSKAIAKDLAYMTANVTKFGNIGQKMIGAVSVYMKKLGLEIKDLEGVMGVFDDFESGAQASAKLSSAFGVQIDSMKMMQAENPAEQMQMLRDAFKASGQSLESLNRQQLKYLGDTTGLGDKVLQALSPENAQASLEDAQSAAAEATSETNRQLMTQSEILKTLATNIKKLPSEGGGGGGGGGGDDEKKKFTSFIDAFTTGFKKAIVKTESFQKMSMNVAEAVNYLGEVGGKVGDKFLATFPQVERIFSSIADIFDPKNFQAKADEIVAMFEKLFEGLKNPATADKAFGDFFESFTTWFEGMFDNPAANSSITIAVEELIGFMGNALSGAIGFLIPKLAEIITDIADFISGDKAEQLVTNATNTGIGGAIKNAFTMIGDKIVEVWPKLSEALGKLFDVMLEKAKPYLIKALGLYLGFIFVQGIVLGAAQAVASAFITTAMGRLAEFMQLQLRGALLKRMTATVAETSAAAVQTGTAQATAQTVAQGGASATAATAGAAGQTAASQGMIASLAAMNAGTIMTAAGNLVLLVGTFLVALALFIAGLIGIHKMISSTEGGYMGVLASLGVVALSTVVIAGLILTAQLLQPSAAGTATAGISSTYPVLFAAGIMMLGMIALAKIAKMLDVGPLELAGYGLALAAIVGSILLVTIAALLLLGVAPDGGATAAATLATAGPIVLAGLALLALALIAMMAVGVSASRVEEGEKLVMSMAKIVGAIGFVALTALGLGALLMNPFTLGAVATGMIALAVMFKAIIPEMGKLLALIAEVKIDPGDAMVKVDLLQKVFSILDPLFKVVEKVTEESTGWATFSTTASRNIEKQLNAIKNFFDTVLDSLTEFVTKTLDAMSKIPAAEKKDMDRAEIVGKMLGPLSQLAGSLLGSIAGIQTSAAEYNWTGTTTKSAVTMEAQLSAIKSFLLGDGTEANPGLLKSLVGTLPDIVKSINEIAVLKGMKKSELETLGKKAELIGTMVGAIQSMSGVFKDIASSTAELGRYERDQKGAAIVGTDIKEMSIDMGKMREFMPMFTGIFETLKSILPTIVDSFNALPAIDLKGSKDPKERIDSIAGAIDSMINGIKKMTGMFPVETDIKKMNTDLSAQAESIKLLAVTATDVMTSLLNNFARLPSLNPKLFEGITKGMTSISDFGTHVSGVESAVRQMQALTSSNLSSVVKTTIDEIKRIDTELASIDSVNINARIEKVGKALALRPEALKIESKPINVNVTLNFTMDAKDLAMEITDMQGRLVSTGAPIKNPFAATATTTAG